MPERVVRVSPARPLRVVDVINLSTSADTLLRERVLALRAGGIDNRIVCMEGPRVETLRRRGIPVHTVPLPRGLDPLRLLASLLQTTLYLRRHRVDVVHTHCSVPGAVGRIAAWLAGVPVIVHTVHGFAFHERTPRFRRWLYVTAERLLGRITDTLLTQNHSDLELAERYGIGPRGRRHLIGNGIDLARFRPEKRHGGPGQPLVLTCVARLEPVKNHRQLFEAARLLQERGRDFRLRLAGNGPLRAEYERACQALGLGERVEFLGYRDDVPALLAETDVAVLTSFKEGIPRAVLEAMAMGIPVVATRVTGTRETVRQGETGTLVEVGDASGLADALATLMADAGLRARMGARGRQVAEEQFDESRITRTLGKLYRTLAYAADARAPAGIPAEPLGQPVTVRRRVDR